MTTKTVRSRFDHEVGGTVAGCKILEKTVIIPPAPAERRLGVFDYLVEVAPTAVPAKGSSKSSSKSTSSSKASKAPERGSFTRATPEEMGGVVRRLPSR